MKMQLRWLHTDRLDMSPVLQFRRTDSKMPNVFGEWSSIPHVYADEITRKRAPKPDLPEEG